MSVFSCHTLMVITGLQVCDLSWEFLLILTGLTCFLWGGGGGTLCHTHSLWDLSSPTSDRFPRFLVVEAWRPNHWTTREFPDLHVFLSQLANGGDHVSGGNWLEASMSQ